MKRKHLFSKISVVFLVIAVISASILAVVMLRSESGSDLYEIHFLNVGQGDSSLIILPQNRIILIDCGKDGDFICEYLKTLGITKIDAIFLTHPHSDHFGGLYDILYEFEIDRIFTNGQESEILSYDSIEKKIKQNNIDVISLFGGDSIEIGNVEINVLAPIRLEHEDDNDDSMVLRIKIGDVSALFMGDCGVEAENELLLKYSESDLQAEIIKIGHHGSNSATSESFLASVNPAYAVISCEKNNEYGHPNAKVINRLNDIRSQVFITYDSDNAVIYKTDGKKTISCELR